MAGVQQFNLLDEPWVRVRHRDGRTEEVSVLDAFRRAPELAGLAGEIPTQDAAVLRLLLAVLYRCLPWGDGPTDQFRAVQGWAQVWQSGRLPMEAIEAYAASCRSRFDLLDPVAPFMQVADLHTASGRTSGLSKLIAEVPDGSPFFTVRTGAGVASLSLAEAARWLVHCQAFDPSGIKSGAEGDDRVSGGKGYPIGVGWTGVLGLYVVAGRSLFETLLLNLDARLASGPDAGRGGDRPVWERPTLGAAPEGRPGPTGPADLMTWPIRRVRLFVDDGVVTDALIANGDRIDLADQFRHEPMSAWRRKSPKDPVYPRGHFAERTLWRGLESSLGAGAATHTPEMAVQEWLALLVELGALASDRRLTLQAVGLVYGSNNSVIDGGVDDSLGLRAGLLARPDLLVQVRAAVQVTEGAVGKGIATLAVNLAHAAGGEPADARGPAREAAYARLDPAFRAWVAGLDADTDPEEARAAWQRVVHAELTRLGAQMIAAAGPRASEGTFVSDVPGRALRLLDSGLADKFFRAALRKELPVVADDLSRSATAQTTDIDPKEQGHE